jgi:hypothetical protein
MQKGPLKQRLDWGWRYWALNGRPNHGVIGSWLSEAAFEGKVGVVAPFFQLWRSHDPVLPAFALPTVDNKGPKIFAFREFGRSSYDIGSQPGGGHNFSSKQLGLPRSGLAIWMLPQNGPAKKVWLTGLRVSKWEGYYESSQIMWAIKGDTNGALAFSFSQDPPSGWRDNLSPKLSRNAAMNPAVSRLRKEGVDIANCHNGVSMFKASRSWIAFCVKVTDVTKKKELGVRSFRYVHWIIEVDSNGMTKVMEHKEQPSNNYWDPIPLRLIGARDINNDGVIDLVWIEGCGSQVFTSNGLSVTSSGHCTC